MAVSQIKLPACTYSGVGSLEKIKEILEKEKVNQLLLFTDPGIVKAGLLDRLTNQISTQDKEITVISDINPEPSYDEVNRILSKIQSQEWDLVIGYGGGSVMDTAKLASVLIGASYSVLDLLKQPNLAQKRVRSLMIPTTCGTGSEATCNAIVAVPEDAVKVGIVNDAMIPDYVILDATTIRHLPQSIVAATGVDALAHAVECYTSRKATMLSDTYAAASAKLIFHHLLDAYQHPENMAAKNALMLAAYYGGIAITGSGTTAVHALSYPLGGKYHIPHGVSNAILFAPVMAFNQDACEDRLGTLCDGVWPEHYEKSTAQKAQIVIDAIHTIVKETEIPTDLKAFGVKPEDLDGLTNAGSKVTRLLDNNMKPMRLVDIKGIYEKVLL